MDTSLVALDNVKVALREAGEVGDIDTILNIKDGYSGIHKIAKARKETITANRAKYAELCAKREAGEFIEANVPSQGGRPEKPSTQSTVNNNVKLRDLDVSRDLSSRWRLLAKMPDEAFEQYTAPYLSSREDELTESKLLAYIKKGKRQEKREQEKADTGILVKELPPTDHEDCYYHDDWIQLWHGDAGNLIFLPDDYIDLIVTSPPYNIGPKSSNGRVLWHGVTYSTYDDKEPEGEYQAKQIAALNELWRVTKPGGSLFYNHKVRNRDGIGIHPLSWLSQTNWTFRQQITWDRGSTHNHEMTYFWPVDELIFWLTKGTEGVYLSPEGAEMTTVWRFNFKINTDHPAPFPTELASRCIRAASQPGDIVLDPFGGSMTTCFVAKQLKRSSIGVDISKDYVVKYAHRCSQGVLL